MGNFESEVEPVSSFKRGHGVARILLVDDDPTFGLLMSRAAEQSHINLTVCSNLADLERYLHWKFDVAIVDYDLGSATGIEVIQQLERRSAGLPAILVSQSNRIETPVCVWPPSIKGFIRKTLGHFAILEAAMAAHDMGFTENRLG